MPEVFSEKEKEILAPFVTNFDKNVFVLKNLPEVVKGALFSRYSRSPKSLRRLLLDEFILNRESGFENIAGFAKQNNASEIIAIQKAEEFYDRVLVGYGDDSVAELGGAHIAIENASNILSKIIEDSRIGLSPLEKSTRYVLFDQKVNGRYLYYLEPKIMASNFADEYAELCDELFDEYSKQIEPAKKFLQEKFPQDETSSERAYNSSIKAKVCDILRVFLPASTFTNLGLYGNGRAFEYLLTKLYSQELEETKTVANQVFEELSKTIPSFIKTVKGKYGPQAINYLSAITMLAKEQESKVLQEFNQDVKEVQLVSFEKNALDKIISAFLFPQSRLPLIRIQAQMQKISFEQKKQLFEKILALRSNRRHKPPRAFEHAFYEFDLLGNFGIYRDLQRHRLLTQQRQLLTTMHGFDTPKEFIELGIEQKFKELMQKAFMLNQKIAKKMPLQAQYVVPFGYRLRWALNINLRELFHLIELRSSIQGHLDYRRMVLKMLKEIEKVQPFMANQMKFAVHQEVDLERLEAEKKTDKKMLEQKKNT